MPNDKYQGSKVMRKLPIGIQDFGKLRRGNHVYVEKTSIIHRLIQGEGAYFLSRPRRFGKSLLCTTIKEIFEGRRELFQETAGFPALAIDSLEWEWKKYPVVLLRLNIGNSKYDGVDLLRSVLKNQLKNIAEENDIVLDDDFVSVQFADLIRKLCHKHKERVVVIIDEYDKPLLDAIDNHDMHIQIRNELKGFYGILKASDEYLRFVFLTGVSKFSHVSIFSDLNHLLDLSLDQRYNDICGLTQEEIENHFKPEIESIIKETDKSPETYLEELKEYYNGYRFSKKPVTLYNPFGLLNHFDKQGEFAPYWYATGTPTFLIDLIKKHKIDILELGNLSFGMNQFQKFDIESMDVKVILYQTGYLTISDYDEEVNEYILNYPNLEVNSSFAQSLIRDNYDIPSNNTDALINKLPSAMIRGNVEGMIEILRQFLASIPYDIIKDTESYYQTFIHLIFAMLGLDCRSEVRIAHGRIDTIVETKRNIYFFEFKLNEPAEKALAQINNKDYLLPWRSSDKKLFKIGICFDGEKRNISEWVVE